MSCEIQLFAVFEGLEKFLQKSTIQDESEAREPKNFFLDFEIAISPTREILVFAKSSWLLICGAKLNSDAKDGSKIKYSPMQHGHLQCKQSEKITSLLCLPFLSFEQSSCGSDWTCIIVGFSSGCIRFYNEGLQELAKIVPHTESILKIKLFCPLSLQQKKTSKQNNYDIYVVCESVICIFNGPNLYQTLLSRKNQLSKSVISQSVNDTDLNVLVDFKKYSYVNQELVTDACYLGQTFLSSCTTFDHLVTASCTDGFNSNYRAGFSQVSLIVTSGKKPFIGFHYTSESSNSPVLADVALAVANKIKSSVTANLPDWLGFGNKKSISQEKPKEVAKDLAEKLNCRFGLCDLRRQGQSINCSPDGLYSAVSDSLGRVVLIENSTGIALQLWKGFRDAQCGFIMAQDVSAAEHETDADFKGFKRVALFIVIYAPRKGVIEIFSTHNGQKVSTFEVTKFGRLIYDPQGYSATTSEKHNSSYGQVIFISVEGLTHFLVPFHCSLTDDSGKMLRDLYILNKIKSLLKTDSLSSKFVEEITNCASELKMDKVRCQAIELLINNRNTTLEAFKAVLAVFLKDFKSFDYSNRVSKSISVYTEIIYNLLSFYEFLDKINNIIVESSETEKNALDFDASLLFEQMKTTEKELNSVLLFINQIKDIEETNKLNPKVTFESKNKLQIGNFVSSFDLDAFLTNLEKEGNSEKKTNLKKCCSWLTLQNNCKEEILSDLGEYLFKGVLSDAVSFLNEWSACAMSCRLYSHDLAVSLISYWCHCSKTDNFNTKEINNFIDVLRAVCLLNDSNDVPFECNTESPWWSRIRSYIASSPYTFKGLLAALCCRSVTIFMEEEQEKNAQFMTISICSEWESLSKETYQWDVFISQMQDVALLNAILTLKLKNSDISGEFPKIVFDFERQCLNSIQLKGTGRVSELTARWLIQFGFNPSVLVNKTDVEFQEREEKEEKLMVTDKSLLIDKTSETNLKTEGTIVLDYLLLLKSRFPYSLTTSTLLINLSWEYSTYWYKNTEDLRFLESAVQCLKIVPSQKMKYGISFLSWSTYLQQKVKSLTLMINRVGKVPKDKLCLQEIGVSRAQVPHFLRIVSDYLTMMLESEVEEKLNFCINREAIWQNCSPTCASSLVTLALSQPSVNSYLVILLLQLITTMLLMSSLNVKVAKFFSSFWDNMDLSCFSIVGEVQPPLHRVDHVIQTARKQFLQKTISAAIQTVELVECVPKLSSEVAGDDQSKVFSTKFNVQEYKKWLQVSFDLAEAWDVTLDDLRRHQVCELYANGLDRLAEEVIPSVNEKELLASQVLVIAGKRLKHMIQDSKNLSDYFSNLSFNLSEWLKCLDTENFMHQNETVDDIEVMLRYVINCLPEDHSNQSLAIAIVESLSFFKSFRS